MDWLPNIATVVVSGALSVAASLITAKRTAQHELTKMGYQYERDDAVHLKEAYAKMRSEVLTFADYASGTNKRKTVTALSDLITVAPQELRQSLQLLQELLVRLQPYHGRIATDDNRKINELLKTLDDIWETCSTATTKKRKYK